MAKWTQNDASGTVGPASPPAQCSQSPRQPAFIAFGIADFVAQQALGPPWGRKGMGPSIQKTIIKACGQSN